MGGDTVLTYEVIAAHADGLLVFLDVLALEGGRHGGRVVHLATARLA